MRDDRCDTSICRMLALGMELPEETFVNLHSFDGPSDSSGAYCTLDIVYIAHCVTEQGA